MDCTNVLEFELVDCETCEKGKIQAWFSIIFYHISGHFAIFRFLSVTNNSKG